MYLQYICSVLFLSLNLEKFGEKIYTYNYNFHIRTYISHLTYHINEYVSEEITPTSTTRPTNP